MNKNQNKFYIIFFFIFLCFLIFFNCCDKRKSYLLNNIILTDSVEVVENTMKNTINILKKVDTSVKYFEFYEYLKPMYENFNCNEFYRINGISEVIKKLSQKFNNLSIYEINELFKYILILYKNNIDGIFYEKYDKYFIKNFLYLQRLNQYNESASVRYIIYLEENKKELNDYFDRCFIGQIWYISLEKKGKLLLFATMSAVPYIEKSIKFKYEYVPYPLPPY